jgi:AraC-like DNA-binding protein
MINYYKYLPVSTEDENWGLCVLNTGCTHVEANGLYPVQSHPAHHYFNWNIGRVLNEFQVIYITNGKGTFESDSCEIREVKAGTIIILFPGERHRYKPCKDTGWDEYWIGMKGNIIDNLVKKEFITPADPCLYIGFHEGIFNLFNLIIEKTKQENSGYQPLISGAALHLMGNFHAIIKQNLAEGEGKEAVINKARLLLRANIENDYSPEQAADELKVGYSWFRKVFKSYTGLSPGQYYIQLKIERAKDLLNNPETPIKEIAYLLRFDTYFYFSTLFKEKTGMTPTDYRKRALGVNEVVQKNLN